MNPNMCHTLRKTSLTLATLVVFLALASVSHGKIYKGDDARQVLNSLSAGQGWCERTRVVTNPLTGIVEQAWCRCATPVMNRAGDYNSENLAIDVTLGPETLCARTPVTPQQQAAAQQQIVQIDTALAQWHNYLQNLSQYCNAWAYYNDPAYRAQCDAWMAQQGAEGQWYMNQLQAQRTALVSVAQGVPQGGGGVAIPGGGGVVNPGGGGVAIPGGGGVTNPGGSGILGQDFDQPRQ